MGSRSKDALYLLHPSVELVFAAFAIILIGLSMHIVCAFVMLAWCVTMNAIINGPQAAAKSLAMACPIIVIFTLLNVLFYHAGGQVTSIVGPISVTVESVLFGISAGCMLASMIVFIKLVGQVISSDSVSALMSSSLPTVGLTMSMVLRLVPQLQRRTKEVRDTASACTCAKASTKSLHRGFKAYTTIMSWSMEESIETALSMRARGWMRGRKRTYFNRRIFDKTDALSLLVVVMLGILSATLLGVSLGAFSGETVAQGMVLTTFPGLFFSAIASCVAFLSLPIIYIVVKRLKWQH